jgi:hypothetical protein
MLISALPIQSPAGRTPRGVAFYLVEPSSALLGLASGRKSRLRSKRGVRLGSQTKPLNQFKSGISVGTL